MSETDKKTETTEEHTKILTIAKTGAELYILNQQLMIESKNEYEKHIRLLKSLTFGLALLDYHKELQKKLKDTLKTHQSTTHKMRMNWLSTQRMYSLGSEDTGKIYVRPEEINVAREEMREQIAKKANKDLEILDYEVYVALMEEHIIRKKSIEETMETKLEQKFQRRLNGKE